MRYMYGAGDDKFIKMTGEVVKKKPPLEGFKFRVHSFVQGKLYFDKHDVPIVFKTTPDTLLNLTIKVVDALPLPSVYKWRNYDILLWIKRYGYPQYITTFRKNLINGRTLLLLDASALSAMNIKNFEDIQHIAYGIRSLFFFELTKFSRSISLPPHYYYELYKLFRVKSGLKYEQVRRSDLWRRMHLIRAKSPNLSHWELLEKWLSLEPDPLEPELFGGVRRRRLYKCKQRPVSPPPPRRMPVRCHCFPPCQCYWSERMTRLPWHLKCLEDWQENDEFVLDCPGCMPPCTCRWSSKRFESGGVLSCLRAAIPQKYGGIHTERHFLKYAKLMTNKYRSSAWVPRYTDEGRRTLHP